MVIYVQPGNGWNVKVFFDEAVKRLLRNTCPAGKWLELARVLE